MASQQPASPGRRSWREAPARAAAGPTRGGSKTPLRVLMTLIVLALIAAFGYLLVQPAKPDPPTHFVALVTGETNWLSTPPILFEEPTLAPLEQLESGLKSFHYEQLTGWTAAGALAGQLKSLAVPADGRLVVYVSAHGVSDGDAAYVLAGEYDVRQPTARRTAVADLLKAVAETPAAAKVVIFDCSRLAASARLGMAVNDFALLVREAAKQVTDPQLAILLAGPDGATSPLGLAEGRAVLGGAVVDALVGGVGGQPSDGNDDGNLTIGELNAYVARRCAASRVAAPQPQLVACGPSSPDAALTNLPILRLAAVSVQEKLGAALDAAQTAKAAAKKPDPKAVAAGAAPTAPAGNAASTGATPATAATTPPAATPPAAATAATDAAAPPSAEGAAPATAPAAEATATPANGAAGNNATAGATTAPAPATAPTPAAPAAEPQLPPMLQAWRLRDRLNSGDPTDDAAPLPADYAPHRWNELNAKLVSLQLDELEHASDANRAPSEAVGQLQPYLRGLAGLADGSASGDSGLMIQLLDARREYLRSGERDKLKIVDQQNVYLRASLNLRRHLVRAYQILQWHAAALGASASSDSAGALVRDIEQYLAAIRDLDAELAGFERQAWTSSEAANRALREVAERDEDATMQASKLAGEIDRQVQELARAGDPLSQRHIEALLATDLATAEQRQSLLAVLDKLANAAAADAAATTEGGSIAAPPWANVVDHLRLEAEFAGLLDADAVKPGSPLAAVRSLQSASSQPAARDRAQVRAAGQALREFYNSIDARVRELQQGGGPDAGRTIERLVAAVHPRDAEEVERATSTFVMARQTPPSEIRLAAPGVATPLREGALTEVTWTLNLPPGSPAPATATLVTFDAADLEVFFDPEGRAAVRGQSATLRPGETTITLFVRPTRPLGGEVDQRTKRLTLQVAASVGNRPLKADAEARVVVPRPNRFDLIVHTVAPKRVSREGADNADRPRPPVEMRPFANRNTTFRFELTNQTDEPKTAKVELFAVPLLRRPEQDPKGGWPPGRLLDTNQRQPEELAAWVARNLDNAAPIATADVAMTDAEGPYPIVFQGPPKPEATAPAAAEGEGAAAAPAPPPAPAVDVTHGLLCRVTPAGEPPLLKWVEVVPLQPSRTFDFSAEWSGNRILYKVTPVDEDRDGRPDLPPGIGEKAPVEISIRGDGVVYPAVPVSPTKYLGATPQVVLDTQPNPGLRGIKTVGMDVDGVPRAVSWQIDFDNKRITQTRSYANIQLLRVGMLASPVVPARLYRRSRVDYPDPLPDAWPTVADIRADGLCTFNLAPGVRSDLEVQLQVDAPVNSFDDVTDSSVVALEWIGVDAPPYYLSASRLVKTELQPIGETGELTLSSKVGEVTIRLPAPPMDGKVATLSATLSVQRPQPLVRSDSLKVAFDIAPPTIESAVLPKPSVVVGTEFFDVDLTITDLSTIETVEAWLTPAPLQSLAELEANETKQEFETSKDLPDQEETRTRRLTLRTPEEIDTYFITLRLTDRSGQTRTTLGRRLTLLVREPDAPPPPATSATLRGKVVFQAASRNVPAGLKVSIKDNAALFGMTQEGGAFEIQNVPFGDYTLTVSGNIPPTKYEAQGEIKVQLPNLKAFQQVFPLPAKMDLAIKEPDAQGG